MPYIGNTTSDFSIDTGNITNRAVTALKLSPSSVGSNGQVLSVDGSGNLQWSTDAALTLIDEDNMSSNSASSVPSQQSVKAYADTKAVLTGSTNNQIVTVTGANAIQGESKLTFDGATLNFAINNGGQGFKIGATGNHYPIFEFDANRSGASSNCGQLDFKWDGTGIARIVTLTGSDTTNKDDGHLAFYTSSAGSLTERLKIQNDGTKLISNGRLTMSSAFIDFSGNVSTPQTGAAIFRPAADTLAFSINNSERVRINSSGKLLIGTTTEGHVSADNLTIADSGNSGISIRSGTSSNGSIYFSDATSGADEYMGVVEYNHTDNALKLYSNAALALTLDSSQKVGIGTASPVSKLHVANDNSFAAKFGGSGGGSDYFIEIGQLGTNGSAGFNATGTSGSMLFKIAGTEYMRITHTTGKVGIGTSNPSASLHVNSGTTNDVATFESTDAYAHIYIKDNSTHATGTYFGVQGNDFRFVTYGSSSAEKLRITSGDVASFGNSSPNAWQTGGDYYNIQLGNAAYLRADTDAGANFFSYGVNTYRDSSGWKFIEDGRATQISHGIGTDAITFYGSNSGTADGTPSFFEMLKLRVDGDVVCGSGNLVLTDGQGIDFSADGNAGGVASELLDDYEEGTWTPYFGTTGQLQLSASYSTQTGTYTKIGNFVYVKFDIITNSAPTGTAGYPLITGLPFTPLVGQTNQGGFPVPSFRSMSAAPVDMRLYPHDSYGHSSNNAIWIAYHNSSGNVQQPNGSTFWAGGRMTGSMSYRVAT